jgi:hypothetical protein
MAETLVYQCSPLPFSVPPLPAHRERVGGLDVIEYRRRSKVWPYGLKLECKVNTREEAKACHTEALQLAGDLNSMWPYVAGVPLFPKEGLGLQLADSPYG